MNASCKHAGPVPVLYHKVDYILNMTWLLGAWISYLSFLLTNMPKRVYHPDLKDRKNKLRSKSFCNFLGDVYFLLIVASKSLESSLLVHISYSA